MNKNAKVWNRFAKRYFKSSIKDPDTYEKKLAMTRAYLTPEMSVLEFGCGTGGTALAHAAYAKEITAVDFSEKMLELAREQAEQAGVHNVRFELAALESFEARDKRYDMTLALSVLHLLEDLDEGLARIHETLQPDGVFVSSTACLAEHHGYLRYLAPLGRGLGVFPYFGVFTEDHLLQSIEKAGFRIEESWKPAAKNAHVLFVVARRLPKVLGKL